jgi:hypothetical protein
MKSADRAHSGHRADHALLPTDRVYSIPARPFVITSCCTSPISIYAPASSIPSCGAYLKLRLASQQLRREIVHHLQQVNDIGERRACEATGFHRSSQRYKSRDDPQTELRMRLKDLAASRVRYGYRRLHILLLREGYRLNHKRTYRLYREEGLSIRSKVPRRKRA